MSSYSSSLEKYLTKVLGSNLVVCTGEKTPAAGPSLSANELDLGGVNSLSGGQSGLLLCFKREEKKKHI
jgi:hypothetical protein